MKVTKVSFQKAFIDAPFLQSKIGFEAEIGKRENPMYVLDKLKKMAEDFHKDANPHLYQESEGIKFEYPASMKNPPVAPGGHAFYEKVPIISKDKERLEIAIDNATTLEELQSIKEECGRAGLLSEYINKFKLLKNKIHYP